MRRPVRAILLLALISAVAACSSSGSSATSSTTTATGSATRPTQGDGGITIYSGQHEQTTSALVKEFTKQTGIPAKVRSADEATLANQLLQEGSDSPADVFYAENPPALTVLDESHLLAPVSPASLQAVPATYRPTSGDWLGVSARAVALAYNTGEVPASALPTSILDLAKPEWKGKVGISPADSDFPPVVGAIVAKDGAKAASAWLAGMRRNAQTFEDEESVVSAVNRGAVAAGIINQYYWYRLQLEVGKQGISSALHYFPDSDPGSVVNISGAAVLASSSHRDDAERFVAFLVSRQAQELITHGDDFEYPARPGVARNPAEPAFSSIAHARIGVASLGNDVDAATLIEKAGLG
jgi:iron(III) transport system substrate-binding protein